ncbi:hypothetical protein BGY98DRAFT_982822 [Russula aff. rugulosa BPL654]|nr:hypothetical protein BGY98DRAFT_982822 [Russula aff. rugulosa BPL654]
MDKTASIVAALKAGKQPSQFQIDAWIDKLLQSELIQVGETASAGELSQNGKKLARDLRGLLEAYKNYLSHKNDENVVQKAIWHLHQADIAASSLDIDIRDYRAIVTSLRTSLQIFWDSAVTEGFGVFSDFASFTRLSFVDAAEFVAEKSNRAAEKLRGVESEVQSGERDSVGIKKQTKEELERADAREMFEKSMDTAKDAGSATIGAAQAAGHKTTDLTDRSRTRLHAAVSTMAKRAREDSEYRRSLYTFFSLAQKWLKATANVATAAAQSTSLESFIDDPTPEKHLIHAVRYVNQLAQSIAGGKNLDDCTLPCWFDDYLAFARRALEHTGDNDPEDIRNTREDLRRRWNVLTDLNSDKGRKWKEDYGTLRSEALEFQERMEQDKDLQSVREAHAQLGRDIDECLVDVAAASLQGAISGTSWLWADLFNVYIPRIVGILKSLPIPRTEYVDEKLEFVLEDLDISSINLLPGQVFVRNITDFEIAAPTEGKSTTTVGALTHTHIKGLQLKLSELSFYYHDLTATVGPKEFSGLAEISLPPEGIDVDIKVRTIPNTAAGLAECAERKRFLRIDHVVVHVSEDVDVRVTKSNHPVLLTVFRPLLTARLRGALQATLSANIRRALDGIDALVWDTTSRAEVFQDVGLGRGPALASAWWSELGRLQRTHGGLFSGWRTTGSGIVRNGADAEVALGAEPQVLGPEKHGPKGTLAQPLKERARNAGIDVDVSAEGIADVGKDVVGKAKEGVKVGIKKVRTFEEKISDKQKEEECTPGWESSAFDV